MRRIDLAVGPMINVTQIDSARCEGGESPLWDAAGQSLFYIDNVGRKVHRYDTTSQVTRTYEMPEPVTAIALRQHGGAVVNLVSGLHALDLHAGSLDCWVPADRSATHRYNDGKVDRRGRFVLGGCTASIQNPKPDGGIFSLDQQRRLTRRDSGIYVSNGPCWSPDNKTFYFSDSWLHTTFAYDYDLESGVVSNRREFVNSEKYGGRPDGATVDADGNVWIAIYGAGEIMAFRPDGKLERAVEMPVRLCSSVMFGGPRLDQLFVTTISHGALGEKVEEGAGYVYRIDGLGTLGMEEPLYAG